MNILLILIAIYLLSAWIVIRLCKRDEGQVERRHISAIFCPVANTILAIVLGLMTIKDAVEESGKNGIIKCITEAILRVLNKL
jgi:hypothetical protein